MQNKTTPSPKPTPLAPGPQSIPTVHRPDADRVRAAVSKRSFATLATASLNGRPHVAGVLYELVDDVLYVNTLRSSRKAQNVAANPRVGLCIPIRRLPIGPPSTVQFQTSAEILDVDDGQIVSLVSSGRLKSITSHGELENPDGCFVAVALSSRLVTYGLGMRLSRLIKDPLAAGGLVEFGNRS